MSEYEHDFVGIDKTSIKAQALHKYVGYGCQHVLNFFSDETQCEMTTAENFRLSRRKSLTSASAAAVGHGALRNRNLSPTRNFCSFVASYLLDCVFDWVYLKKYCLSLGFFMMQFLNGRDPLSVVTRTHSRTKIYRDSFDPTDDFTIFYLFPLL